MLNHRLELAVMLLASVLIAGQPAKANLIVNGGFEDPQIASSPTFGAYTSLQNAMGWTASPSGSNSQGATLNSSYDTQFYPTFWAVAGGHQAALFNEGTGTDQLYQTFATTPGTLYNGTFDLASERGGPRGPAVTFTYIVDSAIPGDPFVQSLAGLNLATPIGTQFVQEAFSFTAITAASTISFYSTGQNGGNAYSPILDTVDVEKASATPEPGSLVLLCTGLASIGGLGWMKKRKTKVVAARAHAANTIRENGFGHALMC